MALLCELHDCLVVIVHNEVLVRCLVDCHSCLGIAVSLHGLVSVQMIRCEVQDRRNYRSELGRCLKLERRTLSYHPGVLICVLSLCHYRVAYVAYYICITACSLENLACEGRCGCLAVGSCDSCESCRSDPVRKLELANDLSSGCCCSLDEVQLRRYARAQHQHVKL